jgi:hypothetical protein
MARVDVLGGVRPPSHVRLTRCAPCPQAVFDVDPTKGLLLVEVADGVTVDDVKV